MELLLIRHGETQIKTGITSTHDGPLTDNGVKQASLTSNWINFNFHFEDYIGFTSPYFGCIQTSSFISYLTGVPFTVSSLLRDFPFEEREGTISIENRSLLFSNLLWNIKEWPESHVEYPEESIDELLNRCIQLLYTLGELRYNKVMLVTHVTTAIILSELALGKTKDELKAACVAVAKAVQNPPTLPILLQQKNLLLHGMAHCGMSLILDKEAHWFNKIVYAN